MPPGNEGVARAIAALFGSDSGSDCVVVFVPHPEPEDEPARKRQRVKEDGEAAEAGPNNNSAGGETFGDQLPAHMFVLKNASDWFRTKLTTDVGRTASAKGNNDAGAMLAVASGAASSSSAASSAAEAAAGSRPVLRVPLGSAAEVSVARAAIAYAYTGEVRVDSVQEALQVWHQAAYLQIGGCGEAALKVVADLLAAAEAPAVVEEKPATGGTSGGGSTGGGGSKAGRQLPPALQLYSCLALWPDPAAEPAFAAILAAAKLALVAYFGATLRILSTFKLRLQLFSLPAEAMEVLLESDEFGTDNESSVLNLLAWWVKDKKCTDAAVLARLCRQVRLLHLSPAYLHHILPALAEDAAAGLQLPAGWFKIRFTEAALIARIAGASGSAREEMLTAAAQAHPDTAASPWYSTEPRRQCIPEGGLKYEWKLAQTDLDEVLQGLQQAAADETQTGGFTMSHVNAGGLRWDMSIEYAHGAAAADVLFGPNLPKWFDVSGSALGSSPGPPAMVLAGLEAHLTVHRWVAGQRTGDIVVERSDLHTVGCHESVVYPMRLLPQQQRPANGGRAAVGAAGAAGGAERLAAWAEYLHDGHITGSVTLMPPKALQQ